MFKEAKYKKFRKSRLKKLELKTNKLKFGTIGLKAAESGIIKSSQIFAAKQTILKKIKKKGKLWVRIFPNLSVTSKSVNSRMGKGKGSISHWVTQINCGNVLFEICNPHSINIISILKNAGSKFPIKTKIIYS